MDMDRKVLKAKDGFVYTDGEIYGDTIYLAEGVDELKFYEITLDEYREILKKEENIEI